jgi:hypothetical protein
MALDINTQGEPRRQLEASLEHQRLIDNEMLLQRRLVQASLERIEFERLTGRSLRDLSGVWWAQTSQATSDDNPRLLLVLPPVPQRADP